jgi:hypothetical protein
VLGPSSAGEVTVRVREEEHRSIAATVVVEHPHLQQAAPRLEAQVREALAREGLPLSAFELSYGSSGGDAQPQPGSRPWVPPQPSVPVPQHARSAPSRLPVAAASVVVDTYA